jgi:S1-C subfamily serine protease
MEDPDNNGYYPNDKTEPYQPAPQPANPAEEQPHPANPTEEQPHPAQEQPHPYAPPAPNRSYPPQQGSGTEYGQYYREYMEPQAYQPSSYSSPPAQPLSDSAQSPASAYSVPDDPGVSGTTSNHQNQSYAQGGYFPYTGNGGAIPPQMQRTSRGGCSRSIALIALVVVVLIVLGVGLFAGWQFGHAQTSANSGTLQTGSSSQVTIPKLTGSNLQAVQEAVVAKALPAVVQITVETSSGEALGSGVIIDDRGYIITNDHVVSGATNVSVALSDGTIDKNVQIVGTDPADDLALVKITPPKNISVIPLGNSSKLTVGQNVLAIGNPLGNTQTVTNGIVSALGRNVSEDNGVTIPNAIQTDAPINPGNSGGALVDLSGNLVGIPTLTAVDPEFNAPANGVGFAIPVNQVSLIATQLIATGKVTHTGRAAIGIEPVDVDAQVQAQDNLAVNSGVLIEQLVNGGAAQKAGLKVGDVIVKINNTTITSTADLENVLIAQNPGDTVTVHVYRGTQQISVKATLGELAAGS